MDVDVDRYQLDDGYRQVMVAVRELNRNDDFRKAITYAIDRQRLGEALVKGPFTAIYPGGLYAGTTYYDKDSTVYYPYSLEDAKALLEKAGLKDTDGNGVVNFPADTPGVGGQDVEITLLANADYQTDKNLAAIPDRFKEDFPANAGGVYDAGTPGTRNPDTGNPGPTLWLPKGKTVRFVLTSRDVIHSFWVVPFLMKQDVIPGHTNAFEVTPNKEGTFLGKCAELCGVDHSRMLFNVKVVSQERYEEHLKSLVEKGQTGYVPAGIEQTQHEKNRETNVL